MKLTKIQRYTSYCILLEEAERPSMLLDVYDGEMRGTKENGLCWMWRLVFGSEDLYGHNQTLVPELHEKSSALPYFSFNNWKERIAALKACIEETHP